MKATGDMKVNWVADAKLSAARAMFVVATGTPCTDESIEKLLIGTATEINHRLVSAAIDNGRFWTCFFDRCVAEDDFDQAATISLARSGCNELQIEQLARSISSRVNEARQLFAQRFPKLDEQLPLRIGPLRARWETVGPGLLRDVERQVWQNSPPPDWWPSSVNVHAVQPLTGGGGGFDPDADSIWIEAVLTDADPQIAEVLRVVWLVTSLAIETHIRSRTGERMISNAWSLVSVPLVLAAGAELGMFAADNLPIGKAVRMWHGGSKATIETLSRWWIDYEDSSTPLPLALKQLEAELR